MTEATQPFSTELHELLRRMASSDARESRLLVAAEEVFLLYVRQANSETYRCEAVSSVHLPPELKLSQGRAQRLRDLGFSKNGGGQRNWSREQELKTEELAALADEAETIIRQIYGMSSEVELRFVEDNNEHPENPALISAIRKVAKSKDEAQRNAMYTEMLNATFLVPIQSERDEDDDDDTYDSNLDHLTVLETVNGHPIFGAFTDWDSLRLWDPMGASYIAIHGSDLFDLLLDRNAAALRINPDGDIGGELYKNEIEMLAEAIREYRQKHLN